MNNVIGPINIADWFFMKELRKSIAFMKTDPAKYKIPLEKEKAILKDFLKAYSTQENEQAA